MGSDPLSWVFFFTFQMIYVNFLFVQNDTRDPERLQREREELELQKKKGLFP